MLRTPSIKQNILKFYIGLLTNVNFGNFQNLSIFGFKYFKISNYL